MSTETNTCESCCGGARWIAYAIAIAGTFLIMGVLVWAMIRYTTPAPVGAQRAEARRKILAEQRVAEAALKDYAWQDQAKGFVRLPIDQAMALTVGEWQNPAEARARLIERVGKTTAVPPKAPEKPSAFE